MGQYSFLHIILFVHDAYTYVYRQFIFIYTFCVYQRRKNYDRFRNISVLPTIEAFFLKLSVTLEKASCSPSHVSDHFNFLLISRDIP